jgi:hypothetical protein
VPVFFDPAHSAMNAIRLAGMLLSRVPKICQEGITFQAAEFDASVKPRSAHGRCVAASHAGQRKTHRVAVSSNFFS